MSSMWLPGRGGKELSPELQHATKTLLRRSQILFKRAHRARIGSNEREKCLALSQLMIGCVVEIQGDKKLAKSIQASGWDAGHRALASRIVAYVRERDKDKDKQPSAA